MKAAGCLVPVAGDELCPSIIGAVMLGQAPSHTIKYIKANETDEHAQGVQSHQGWELSVRQDGEGEILLS